MGLLVLVFLCFQTAVAGGAIVWILRGIQRQIDRWVIEGTMLLVLTVFTTGMVLLLR